MSSVNIDLHFRSVGQRKYLEEPVYWSNYRWMMRLQMVFDPTFLRGYVSMPG